MDADATANAHYAALRSFLSDYLASVKPLKHSAQRASAKDKLAKLSKSQFQELSTDVYDELQRRLRDDHLEPFLKVVPAFHQKRNQARQKLATLPVNRFRDLAVDVFYELERRFPVVVENYVKIHGDFPINLNSPPLDKPDPKDSKDPKSAPLFSPSTYLQPDLSPPPQLKPDLNFSSLENLMADLGSMLTPDTEKLKLEYETTISSLQSRIKELELQSKSEKINEDKIHNLELLLETQIESNKQLELQFAESQKLIEKLKSENKELTSDFEGMKDMLKDIRLEASQLLDEIKSLNSQISTLKSENLKLTEKLNQPHAPPPPQQQPQQPHVGVISRDRVTAYQSAIEDLLRAARSDAPTTVLVATKSVVIACKNISADLDSHTSVDLESLKLKMSEKLTDLMTASKQHATSFGMVPVSELDNAATGLTSVVVEILKILGIKGSGSDRNSYISNGGGGGGEVDVRELKGYLETQTDRIVGAIQGLLASMRGSGRVDQDVREINGIVDAVVKVCWESLSESNGVKVKLEAEELLKKLESANTVLREMGGQGYEHSKTVKQKLASCSYEIAKYVKELISLME